MNKFDLINFENIDMLNIPKNTFVAFLDNRLQEDVRKMCFTELKMPIYYFKLNWDGLEDCLRDLSWIDETTIFIINKDLPNYLSIYELKIYLEILGDSVAFWSRYSEHKVKVFFEKQDEEYLRPIIEGLDFYYLTHEE